MRSLGSAQVRPTAKACRDVCVCAQVSLDVEGAEESILRSFPFHEFRVRILIVERPEASRGGILAVLRQHGLERVGKLPELVKGVQLDAQSGNSDPYPQPYPSPTQPCKLTTAYT